MSTGFRLVARRKSNRTVSHRPVPGNPKTPRCGSSGTYLRLHVSHPDVVDLDECPGCAGERNVHKRSEA